MNKIFKVIAAFFVVIILVVALIPFFISSDDIVKQVSEQVQTTTGRVLSIDGDKSFSVFPSLSLQLENVRFSNMESGSKADMVTMKALAIHIPWLSLFSGELIVERFVIEQPNILLETDKAGKNNWQLLAATAEPTASDTSASGSSTLPEQFDLSLGQVEVNGGKLTFIDHRTDSTTVIDELELALVLPSLREKFTFNGSLNYMDETFDLEANLTTPAKLINNQAVQVELALTSSIVNLNYQGELLESGATIKGHLALDTPSVKNILAWQKQSVAMKDNALNQFSFNTDMHFSQNTLTLAKLDAKLDQLAFTGQSALTLSSPLQVNLDIDLGELDLNPYLADAAENSSKAAQSETENDTNKEAQPIVWDNSTIDLSALKQLNANIKLSSSKLIFREIKLDENEILLKLENGNAKVTLNKFNAYQGKGSGEINLISAVKPYKISSKFSLEGIQANPLLNDAAGFDKLLGQGQFSWNLNTQGLSQRDFVEKLNGTFGFNLSDGAVKGANLAAIARSAESLLNGDVSNVSLDKNFDQAQKTDFASFIANFTVTNGVANTSDLALANPFIRVNGQGGADLPKTDINFKVQTKLIASADGQQSEGDSSGVTIPMKITGQFHKIKVRPDVSSATKDKVKDKLKDKLKGLFN
ncbi:AsmA family protein [Colwellia asteriadis]|uniref:AsmA family protein n=1 Tax=Colwellia asteriadis TaxID=517723 RepID=A0ABN1L4K1_9GAMM